MTPQEKRRARDRERATLNRIAEATRAAREQGFREGVIHGANAIRNNVLDQAGQLYKERKDNDAAAVRNAHRLLPSSV